ncbi:MAG TPA: serine protease [Casimicrobiaceae bacterium]|nr:serine protease [Casimicrobiaceae bacterium]
MTLFVALRRLLVGGMAGAFLVAAGMPAAAADPQATIARVKNSIVAIGTYERTRTPPFQFLGTGFAVGDGTLIVTNAHVLPPVLDPGKSESVAILSSAPPKDGRTQAQMREARRVAVDPGADLAVLKVDGPPLPPLKIRDSDTVREGQEVFMTGYPVGAVLGPFAATHRGMVAAITPIAIPQARAADLDPATLRRLSSGTFPVFQLDATAYPGNSGSPIYDPETGDVLGIVNMVLVKGTKEAALSQPTGITYAIPARHLQDLLDQKR